MRPFIQFMSSKRDSASVPVVLHVGAPPSELPVGIGRQKNSPDVPTRVAPLASTRHQGRVLMSSPSLKKKIGFVLAGVLGASGVAYMLLDSGGTTPSQVSTPSPTAVVAELAPVNSEFNPGAPSEASELDPRAFAIAEVLDDGAPEAMPILSDVTADVVSRNGDVVLVAVHGTSKEGNVTTVSVLLVRKNGSWVARETYAANTALSARSTTRGVSIDPRS